ncbi:FAD-binding oxidoreductase [Streptomyces sp. I05A-00742]|uniref:NAD(P)/FAD-dependent oxidoreductase n=1 Tax=Streptomyces sp. I05A-00742 TaxID=2732853 RepID=UPI00148940C2|nr:FAD-dependent oxidoreductase [Streptomyces sp. I05A-00742]
MSDDVTGDGGGAVRTGTSAEEGRRSGSAAGSGDRSVPPGPGTDRAATAAEPPSGTYDVAVIGAGVVGASTARELAAAGARVLLLDRSSPAGAGSRAAAGVGVPSVRLLSDPALLAFALAGRRALEEDVTRLTALTGRPLAVRCGVLRPVPDGKEAERLLRLASGQEEFLGTWVPREALREREPAWRGTAHGAFHDPGALVVDAAGYVDALVAEAVAAGADTALGTGLTGLEDGPGGVRLALADGRTVYAGRAVLACGAWAGALPGGPPLPVRPVRGQMLRLDPGPEGDGPPAGPRHIVSGPLYTAPAPGGGGVLVGATEEDTGFTEGPTAEGALLLLAHAARSWPRLRAARLAAVWSGFRAVTPDGRPLIGTPPGRRRLVVASGHGGQGILTGGHTGRLVARLLAEGREDVPETAPFSPSRPGLGASA